MKQIINEDGEIVDTLEENELVEKKLFELGIINNEILQRVDEVYEQLDWLNYFKFSLEKAMRENNISQWKTDSFTASIPVDKETGELKTENINVGFDEERFKKENPELYNKYQMLKKRKVGLIFRRRKDS